MFANIRLLKILTILNLLATTGAGWWVYTKGSHTIDVDDLENLLEELAENNPHFLVSLLNEAANESAENEKESLEQNIFQNRMDVLKAGFSIKTYSSPAQKELVIFADMTDANSIMYLKNIQKILASMNCSIHLIPISMFGKKSSNQAELIWAASLQNPQKAFHLALTYNAVEGAQNNPIAEAEKLGLDTKKLLHDKASKHVYEEVSHKTKLAEKLGIGSPSIFLLTASEAYLFPPAEAIDIPKLIENPTTDLDEEVE